MEKFTQEKTKLCKGVAILIMLFHHLFFRSESWPLYIYKLQIREMPLIGYIASQGKICVAIFILLSAYGLTYSIKKHNPWISGGQNTKRQYLYFVIDHVKKLYMLYWPVFVLAMCIGMITQVSNPLTIYKSFGEWIRDFLGVAYIIDGKTPFNSEWWYISFALTLYLVFPILYLLMKKFPKITLIFAFLIGIRPNSNIMIFMEWRRYLFVCCLGIYFAENDLMSKLIIMKSKKYRIVASTLLCLILGGIRCIHPFTLDGFLVISIIVFSVSVFESGKYISKILISLGTYSGTMFLLHGLLYRNFMKNFIYGFNYPIFIYFVLVVLSYSMSVLIEKLKGQLFMLAKKSNLMNKIQMMKIRLSGSK